MLFEDLMIIESRHGTIVHKNQEFKDLVRLDVVCMFLSCRGAPRPYKSKGQGIRIYSDAMLFAF